jgi:hypothetical protein
MTHVPSDVVSLVAVYGVLYGVVIVVGLVLLVLLVLRLTASREPARSRTAATAEPTGAIRRG